ncbi:hypothetical protein CWI84_08115 [Idiomarina tyrosinivorans]|uniref:Uncharacterized protein n=1 Tax=Idiomarina tyrosinivorans TaxID=1445662 RepID=A0A432ZQ15_9GAMM|nr:hypothetical protein [Idiomarina tyrosinivorans]RUO79916.1 hypothetical protein CWI84_08115 [Idiomarina tyrosinivorans]
MSLNRRSHLAIDIHQHRAQLLQMIPQQGQLLVCFHQFCDLAELPERLHLPVPFLLSALPHNTTLHQYLTGIEHYRRDAIAAQLSASIPHQQLQESPQFDYANHCNGVEVITANRQALQDFQQPFQQLSSPLTVLESRAQSLLRGACWLLPRCYSNSQPVTAEWTLVECTEQYFQLLFCQYGCLIQQQPVTAMDDLLQVRWRYFLLCGEPKVVSRTAAFLQRRALPVIILQPHFLTTNKQPANLASDAIAAIGLVIRGFNRCHR